MRISYNWLQALVPDLNLSPREVADLLTLHSFETIVAGQYGVPAGIKTVRITKVKPHPNADRLRLATITAGVNEITLVCGAPNIAVGHVVPYSAPGAELVNERGNKFVVEAKNIRGEMSEGMLNSLRELSLHHDHAGIWILPEDTPIGVELTELIPRDTILEADITPNRAHDCLSHIGVARELAALLAVIIDEPQPPELPEPQSEVAGYTATLENPRLSPRLLIGVVDNLALKPSPLWLQARLLSAGGKPINNVVDATNYVLFEYGNPTHVYDRSLLAGKSIAVRSAKDGEQFVTLDDAQHTLAGGDLVITADDTPVSLAGIRGGKNSGIRGETSQGLMEVANFNAYNIQETSRRLGLRTDSSARFSKGLDPNLVDTSARRLAGLLGEVGGAKVVGVIDTYPSPVKPRRVSFNPARVSQIAGSDIFVPEKSKSILERLRFSVDDTPNPWQVDIPTDRLDIEGEHDLIEEVVRVTGLDKIAPNPPRLLTTHYSLPPNIYWREIIRETLVELGFSETYNYSFQANGELQLANPPAPEKKYLRTSLIPGLLANADKNRAEFQRVGGGALFEIGHVYQAGEGGRVPSVIEHVNLAAVIAGPAPSLETISQALSQALSVDLPDRQAGSLALKNIISSEDISRLKYQLPVFGFELDLDELLLKVAKEVPAGRSLEEVQAEPIVPTKYVPLPKYPSIFRDISMLVAPEISVEQARDVIERIGGDLVADVDLFDEFQPAGQPLKSLAFHIEYRSTDKTLTDVEINPVHAKVIQALETDLAAQIR